MDLTTLTNHPALWFLVLGLAVSRLSSLVASETGPWGVLDRMRYAIGVRFDVDSKPYGTNELSKMMICPWCNSLWIGLIVALLATSWAPLWVVFLPFAWSEVAIIGDRLWK